MFGQTPLPEIVQCPIVISGSEVNETCTTTTYGPGQIQGGLETPPSRNTPQMNDVCIGIKMYYITLTEYSIVSGGHSPQLQRSTAILRPFLILIHPLHAQAAEINTYVHLFNENIFGPGNQFWQSKLGRGPVFTKIGPRGPIFGGDRF